MLYVLDLCYNSNFLILIYYVKLFLKIISIFLPIVLIAKIILEVYKKIINPNEENNNLLKNIITIIVALIIIFLIYPIMNLLFNLEFFDKVSFINCWNNATSIKEINSYNKSINLNVSSSEINGNNTILECFGITGCNFELPVAHRNNYEFLGWSTSSDCKNIINNSYYTTFEETDLYACYKEIKKDTNNINKNNNNNNTNTINKTEYTIFVGDSRTVGMCSYLKKELKNTEKCVAEVGKSLSWFESNAISKVNNIIKADNNIVHNIVIDLGVNGLNPDKATNYANTYNRLKQGDWKNQNIIIVSVTPVNEKTYKKPNFNEKIKQFNYNLKNKLNSNIVYCDIYDEVLNLIKNERNIRTDGLHYTKSGSTSIYYLKKNCI